MRPIFSGLLGLVSVGLALGLADCDATGTVTGGAPLIADPCAATGTSSDWNALYTCYFGPTGKASCSAQASCHASSTGTGALSSGFICGGTSVECWRSMTQCPLVEAGSPADGATDAPEGDDDEAGSSSGGGSACGCDAGVAPIAACGTSDPTSTTLLASLRGAGGANCPSAASPLCMPLGGYSFTKADLDRISAWIKGGALYASGN